MQPKTKLLQALQANLRLRHFSRRTEKAYVGWVRRFVWFHGLRHSRKFGEREVLGFLAHLRLERGVAASTQTQALAALLFLYREVLGRPLQGLGAIPRPRAPASASAGRVDAVGVELVLYGSGLRLLECLTLRVKDVDLERGELRMRGGKGGKARVTVTARSVRGPLG
jgi:site-specific recombinase XerD